MHEEARAVGLAKQPGLFAGEGGPGKRRLLAVAAVQPALAQDRAVGSPPQASLEGIKNTCSAAAMGREMWQVLTILSEIFHRI